MMRSFIQKRFNKWLKRRMPATKQVTLNSGNTFIFPSKSGIHFLICCIILFLLGTNYQNNLILFLVFFLCSFMITCLLLSYQNLAGLTLTGIESKANFAKQDCQFNLRLTSSEKPVSDVTFSFQKPSSTLHTMNDGDNISLYACSKLRGYFNPGRVTIRSTFPFGLFNVWTHIDFAYKVLLYPQPLENKMPTNTSFSGSKNQSIKQQKSGVDEFSTLKQYQRGESLKSVAWKQLAQGRGWLSKQFEQTTGGNIALDINSLNHLPLETRLSYLCYHILELEKKQQSYSLTLAGFYIEADVGEQHKHQCLQALALYK